MRQVFYPKGGDKQGDGGRVWSEPWTDRLAYDSTKLKRAPIVTEDRAERVALAEQLDALAQERAAQLPAAVLGRSDWNPDELAAALAGAHDEYRALTARMVALQEELDWLTYQSYQLLPRDTAAWNPVTPADAEPLAPGHRPFEIALARHNVTCAPEERSQWFSRHGHDEVTDIPAHYSAATRARLQARLALIADNADMRLLEQPQFKRRWQMPAWDKEVAAACESWLLDRLEDLFAPPLPDPSSDDASSAAAAAAAASAPPPGPPPPLADPRPYTLEEITAAWQRDPRVQAVADVYAGGRHTVLSLLAERLLDEHGLPDHPYRIYTDEGLRKLRQWQEVWRLQDREDAGEKLKIPKPPEFAKGDFQSERYFKLRGKLNVPRERFLVFAELLPARYGWNGWRDLKRALAQVESYTAVEQHPTAPLPRPSTDDPRRCGATLGLWESLPDVKRWVSAAEEGGLRALAEEVCQRSACPCEVVQAWQAWQSGTLEITAADDERDPDEVTLDDRILVMKRFGMGGVLSINDLQGWWNRGPAELDRILDTLVATGELTLKGKGNRRRYTPGAPKGQPKSPQA